MSYIFDISRLPGYGFPMATMFELSQAVHTRRAEMGLTQSFLAKLSGLSRQTINQLEKGTIKDLSLNRAERLASVLGLSLHVNSAFSPLPLGVAGRLSPLARAARTASVSYSRQLQPDQLRDVLIGKVPVADHAPQLHALLDEAPVSLLASVVEQLHEGEATSRADLWKRLRKLAHQLKSQRDIWQ